VLKLMFGAMTRAADRWRAIKFTDFERRQIATVRQELDQEYQNQITTPAAPSAPASAPRFSSSSRTSPAS
jgi:putative transposase